MNRSARIVDSYLQKLPPDEAVIWTGRPNERAFMQRQHQEYKRACIWASMIPAASLVSLVYNSNPLVKFLLGITLLVFFWFLLETFWTAPKNYSRAPRYLSNTDYLHAPWYALTNAHFIIAVFDEGDFDFHKAKLSNIVTIGQAKIDFPENTLSEHEIGTIICTCYYSLATLTKKIKIELVENPRQVETLLRDVVPEFQAENASS